MSTLPQLCSRNTCSTRRFLCALVALARVGLSLASNTLPKRITRSSTRDATRSSDARSEDDAVPDACAVIDGDTSDGDASDGDASGGDASDAEDKRSAPVDTGDSDSDSAVTGMCAFCVCSIRTKHDMLVLNAYAEWARV